jgi:hypothetical protein
MKISLRYTNCYVIGAQQTFYEGFAGIPIVFPVVPDGKSIISGWIDICTDIRSSI